MADLNWLHLSDWHQRGKDFDRKVVLEALLQDIEQRKKISSDLKQIDFVVFSGDAAFSAKKEEYEATAEHLLHPVLKELGLEKKRLFIVPGNHDLDRGRFKFLPEELKKHLLNRKNKFRNALIRMKNAIAYWIPGKFLVKNIQTSRPRWIILAPPIIT